MDEGIFSTYRQGENRVTASILAVLRSLTLPRIEHILGALLQESEFQLVRFENQIGGAGESVPDGEIFSNSRILLETKTKHNALILKQLKGHLDQLGSDPGNRLLALTPDHSKPAIVEEVNDKRLVWASFSDLNEAINNLLSIEKEVVSEREEFLLRELQKMFQADKLLRPARDVVVVAARIAWPEYQKYHAYLCQPNRSFQQVEYLAFYSDGQIQPIVPKIIQITPEVLIQDGLHEGPMGDLIKRILKDGKVFRRGSATVFLLSAPDDPQTIKLDQPVKNDLNAAFVQGQRYLALSALRKVNNTSELVKKTE